jgi:hypothetical protein
MSYSDWYAGFPDLSAAKHADVLFVKEKSDGENDLATYCTRENISHVLFSDFSKALPAVRSIVEGEKTPKEWFGIGRAWFQLAAVRKQSRTLSAFGTDLLDDWNKSIEPNTNTV